MTAGAACGATTTFFLVQQDDGNLCVYRGASPANMTNGAIWCSGATAVPTWGPDGKLIVSGGGQWAGVPIYNGQWADGPQFTWTQGTWLKAGTSQKWSFMADSTIRLSSDTSKCLRAFDINGVVATTGCDSPLDEVRGWSYQAADRSIRKTNLPGRCLIAGADGSGWSIPLVSDGACPLEIPDMPVLYKQESTWDLR